MDVYNNKRRARQIPTFGSWESYEGIPFTSYFESASRRVFLRHYSYSGDDDDLYRRAYDAAIPFQSSRIIGGQEKGSKESQADADDLEGFPPTRAARMSRPNPKPVDEDLYEIPAQLVHANAKRKKKRRSGFFTRCLLPVICA